MLRFNYPDAPSTPGGPAPEIAIRLDLYEMLWRLGRGGLPAPADLQGQHLSLTIFKNMLGTAPYQAILLTVTGHDVHHIGRSDQGLLTLRRQDTGVDDLAEES